MSFGDAARSGTCGPGPMEMRQCPRCGETRTSDEFYDARHNWCRPCTRQRTKDWKLAHRIPRPLSHDDTQQTLEEELEAMAYHP